MRVFCQKFIYDTISLSNVVKSCRFAFIHSLTCVIKYSIDQIPSTSRVYKNLVIAHDRADTRETTHTSHIISSNPNTSFLRINSPSLLNIYDAHKESLPLFPFFSTCLPPPLCRTRATQRNNPSRTHITSIFTSLLLSFVNYICDTTSLRATCLPPQRK